MHLIDNACLRRLEMRRFFIQDYRWQGTLSNLQSLRLEGCHVDSGPLMEYIATTPSLRTLEIVQCFGFSQPTRDIFAAVARSNIERFYFSSVQCYETDLLVYLADQVREADNKTLKELSLSLFMCRFWCSPPTWPLFSFVQVFHLVIHSADLVRNGGCERMLLELRALLSEDGPLPSLREVSLTLKKPLMLDGLFHSLETHKRLTKLTISGSNKFFPGGIGKASYEKRGASVRCPAFRHGQTTVDGKPEQTFSNHVLVQKRLWKMGINKLTSVKNKMAKQAIIDAAARGDVGFVRQAKAEKRLIPKETMAVAIHGNHLEVVKFLYCDCKRAINRTTHVAALLADALECFLYMSSVKPKHEKYFDYDYVHDAARAKSIRCMRYFIIKEKKRSEWNFCRVL